MAEFSYPFDAGAGAIVTEDNWSTMAGLWQDDGVVTDNVLSVSLSVDSNSIPNQVILKPGRAFIQGFMYENTDDLILPFSTNESSDPRRDRIVLRLDRDTNTIHAVVKEGTPAPTPSVPSLNTAYPIHEISLANFQLSAGGSTVSSFIINIDRNLIGKRTRISDTPAAYGKGSVVYNPVDNKFYGVGNSGPAAFYTGEPPSGGGGPSRSFSIIDDLTDVEVSGTDETSLITTPAFLPGVYLVQGLILYYCDTLSSTGDLGIYSDGTGRAHAYFNSQGSSGSPIALGTTTTTGSIMTHKISTPVSNTWLPVTFQAVFDLQWEEPIDVSFTPNASGPQWTFRYGSYVMVEKIAETS